MPPDPDPEPSCCDRQAVFFTENLRHGGFTNTTDVPRLTVHVGYGPGESRLPCELAPPTSPRGSRIATPLTLAPMRCAGWMMSQNM